MGRFLALTLFFIMAGGLALHQEVELYSFGDWIGKLPGDMIVKKKGMIFYFPVMSALLASGSLSLLASLLSKK